MLFHKISSYSICSSPPPPPILMFSAQREDKGSVCTCAGEHLNKCTVFVQKEKNILLSAFYYVSFQFNSEAPENHLSDLQ